MLIPTVFIKANYRELLLAAGESDTENTPCELSAVILVEQEWSGLRSSVAFLQAHHSAPATALLLGKTAGLSPLLSLQVSQASLATFPPLTAFPVQPRAGDPQELARDMGTFPRHSLSLSALSSRVHSAQQVMSHPQTAALHYTYVQMAYVSPRLFGKCR